MSDESRESEGRTEEPEADPYPEGWLRALEVRLDAFEEAVQDIGARAEAAQRLAGQSENRARQAEDGALNAGRQLGEAKKELVEAWSTECRDIQEAIRQASLSIRESEAETQAREAEKNARTGLREFVRNTLADIMAGVDDAAAIGSSNHLMDGLAESGLVFPSRVGEQGGGGESVVEFDLAVIVNNERTESSQADTNVEVEASVSTGSFMEVIGLGFSAALRAGRSTSEGTEESQGTEQHNRIRFAVPIAFATQNNPFDGG